MQKEGTIRIGFIVILIGILSIGSVWAYEITLTAVNATHAGVSIDYQENVYAYEVNLDYTGSIGGVTASSFLGAGATYGYATRDSILSGYGSRLDSTRTGVNASGELFNVTHVGGLSLRYAILIYANGTEESIIMSKKLLSKFRLRRSITSKCVFSRFLFLASCFASFMALST